MCARLSLKVTRNKLQTIATLNRNSLGSQCGTKRSNAIMLVKLRFIRGLRCLFYSFSWRDNMECIIACNYCNVILFLSGRKIKRQGKWLTQFRLKNVGNLTRPDILRNTILCRQLWLFGREIVSSYTNTDFWWTKQEKQKLFDELNSCCMGIFQNKANTFYFCGHCVVK